MKNILRAQEVETSRFFVQNTHMKVEFLLLCENTEKEVYFLNRMQELLSGDINLDLFFEALDKVVPEKG